MIEVELFQNHTSDSHSRARRSHDPLVTRLQSIDGTTFMKKFGLGAIQDCYSGVGGMYCIHLYTNTADMLLHIAKEIDTSNANGVNGVRPLSVPFTVPWTN